MQSYKELTVWQRAFDLVALVYEASTHFPKEERYGLTSQIRRSAVSVASNIAEGNARGSLCETETQLLLAERLGFLTEEQIDAAAARIGDVGRLLSALIRSLARPR